MEEILSYCGFRCDICPAYIENIKNDNDRQKLSDGWKRIFGFDVPPAEVHCVGCKNDGKHPDSNCQIRHCASEKKVENCAYCKDFICDKLKTRIDFVNDFLKIKKSEISKKDYEYFVKPYEGKERLLKIREKIK